MTSPRHRQEESKVVRDLVAAGVGRVDDAAVDAAESLVMDEDAFTAFYDLTARPLWGYLAHVAGDPHAADDLLQESYYRFLRARCRWESDAHRRNYLYRIATNLAHDRRRRKVSTEMRSLGDERSDNAALATTDAGRPEEREDLRRALARLSARDRELLWLAYAEGSTHQEIAETLGLRSRSIRVMLFRARRKMADLLGAKARRGGAESDAGVELRGGVR
jgi:RNA polymerase sigma-70 factor, ECF subfamily